MDSKIPPVQGPRAPYLGITPLALETTQRYLKRQQKEESKPSCMKMMCLILFVLTAFNTLFAVMMMYKNGMIIQENQQLIEENRDLIAYVVMLSPVIADGFDTKPQKFAKMVDGRLPMTKECPPCPTTPKPNPIEPYKNPVSILNEKLQSSDEGKASYDCIHTCLNPPIHEATLTISGFTGKSWSGKGKSKSDSKQVAAYRAIKELYSELEDEIGDEHIPDENYGTACNTPNPKDFLLSYAKKSC